MTSRSLSLLVVSTALLVTSYLIWPRPRLTNYDGLAMEVLQDILEGDGTSYCAMVAIEELRIYGVSRKQCSDFIREQVTPGLRSHHRVEGPNISSTSTIGEWHATATIRFQINGLPHVFHVDVQEENDVPTTSFTSMVTMAMTQSGLELIPPDFKSLEYPCLGTLARCGTIRRRSIPFERYSLTKLVSWNTMGMPIEERTFEESLARGVRFLHRECPPQYGQLARKLGLPEPLPESVE